MRPVGAHAPPWKTCPRCKQAVTAHKGAHEVRGAHTTGRKQLWHWRCWARTSTSHQIRAIVGAQEATMSTGNGLVQGQAIPARPVPFTPATIPGLARAEDVTAVLELVRELESKVSLLTDRTNRATGTRPGDEALLDGHTKLLALHDQHLGALTYRVEELFEIARIQRTAFSGLDLTPNMPAIRATVPQDASAPPTRTSTHSQRISKSWKARYANHNFKFQEILKVLREVPSKALTATEIVKRLKKKGIPLAIGSVSAMYCATPTFRKAVLRPARGLYQAK